MVMTSFDDERGGAKRNQLKSELERTEEGNQGDLLHLRFIQNLIVTITIAYSQGLLPCLIPLAESKVSYRDVGSAVEQRKRFSPVASVPTSFVSYGAGAPAIADKNAPNFARSAL